MDKKNKIRQFYGTSLTSTKKAIADKPEQIVGLVPMREEDEKVGFLLLDLFPNAAFAYSLRRLRYGYTGSAIRVRRSSDNAEQDIGFVGNDLDTASLLSFVGVGDGFVSVWYDQSLNGYDVSQLTASNQPLIVDNGVLESKGGESTIRFNNTSLSVNTTSIYANGERSNRFTVTSADNDTGNYRVTFAWNGQEYRNTSYNQNKHNMFVNNLSLNGDNYLPNLNYLNSYIFSNNDNRLYTNGVLGVSDSTKTVKSVNELYLGLDPENISLNHEGTISEVISIRGDLQAEDRGKVETNINNYYNIY